MINKIKNLEPEKKLEDYAYEVYKGKLPLKLIEKNQPEPVQDKDKTKKLDDKKENADMKPILNATNQNINIVK